MGARFRALRAKGLIGQAGASPALSRNCEAGGCATRRVGRNTRRPSDDRARKPAYAEVLHLRGEGAEHAMRACSLFGLDRREGLGQISS